MIDHGKYNVLGVMVDAVDYESSVERIVLASRAGQPLATSALAVHGVMTGALNAEHLQRLNHLQLIVPDGQPVRWALRWLHGVQLPDRVYGPELMLKLCARFSAEDLPIGLFGGTRELLDRLGSHLRAQFPDLRIATSIPSRFRQLSLQEGDQLVEEIRQSGATLTFVGLGCPRQEVWAYEFCHRLDMPVIAVGAAFNMHAGLLPQAPPRLQACGLEWLYRLWQEPQRLWKRYLMLNPMFLTLLALQLTNLKRFDAVRESAPPPVCLYG